MIKKGKLKPLDYVLNVKKEIIGLISAVPNFIKTGLLCWETPLGAELGLPRQSKFMECSPIHMSPQILENSQPMIYFQQPRTAQQ